MASYNRLYINLQEESKRYCIENKKVYGKCIIEEKDNTHKIVVNVENLKPNNYFSYLLVNQRGQYVAIPLDKLNENFQLKKVFSSSRINNTKFLLKDMVAIMIGAMEKDKLIPILIGYKKDKINYKNNFYVYKKPTQEKNNTKSIKEKVNKQVTVKYKNDDTLKNNKLVVEVEKDDIENKIIKDQSDINTKDESIINIDNYSKKNNTDTNNKINDKTLENNVKPLQEDVKYKNLKSDENANVEDFFVELFSNDNDDDSNETIFSNMLSRFKEEIDEIKYISEISNNEFAKINNSILQFDVNDENSNLKYIFEHNNSIKPFEKQNKDVMWVTIDLKELTVIDNKCWELRRNPFVLQGYGTYGHLILGKFEKENNSSYLIGIPSTYDVNNVEDAKKMGVIQYKPCDNPRLLNSVPGYWIILKN